VPDLAELPGSFKLERVPIPEVCYTVLMLCWDTLFTYHGQAKPHYSISLLQHTISSARNPQKSKKIQQKRSLLDMHRPEIESGSLAVVLEGENLLLS
jgi:hypothetical protein